MALKIAARKATEVPRPTAAGKVNEDMEALKAQMAKLPAGSVLEIEGDRGRTVRGVKALVTRAAREAGRLGATRHCGSVGGSRRRIRRIKGRVLASQPPLGDRVGDAERRRRVEEVPGPAVAELRRYGQTFALSGIIRRVSLTEV